jgi:transposase-like protein
MRNVAPPNMIAGLRWVGTELAAAREVLAYYTELAKTAARDAAEDGVPEALIARELGVARSPTVRRWLGKA